MKSPRLILLLLVLVAALAITSCAGRSEDPTVIIPTATPVDTPTPLAAPGQSTVRPTPNPTPTPRPTPTPAPTATPTATPTPTPTPTPAPSIATAKAAALLVATLGVPAGETSFDMIKRVEWRDTSLGCPEPGRNYSGVIVPGWIIVVRHASRLYEYHSDLTGDAVVTCDPKLARSSGTVNPATALRLQGVTKVEVGALTNGGTPVPALTIDDPAVVAQVVASLNIDLPLYEPKRCTPPIVVSFRMGDRTASVLYACPGDGTVLRGTDGTFDGKEARAPEAFQKLINTALGNRPFPAMPDGQQG